MLESYYRRKETKEILGCHKAFYRKIRSMSYKEEAAPIYEAIRKRTEEYFEAPLEHCLDGEANRAFQIDIVKLNKQLKELKKKYETEETN